MFLTVDDDSSDLLIHEDQDGAQEGRDGCCKQRPCGVIAQRGDQPTPVFRGGLLDRRKTLYINVLSL